MAGYGLSCKGSQIGLQTGRCPLAARSAVSGLRSHNPPASLLTSAPAVWTLTLGPCRFLEPIAASLCMEDLVDGKYKTETEV